MSSQEQKNQSIIEINMEGSTHMAYEEIQEVNKLSTLIGIFDSGVGGVSILSEIRKLRGNI